MILAFETATSVCSVAAYNEDNDSIKELRSIGKGVHSRDVLSFVHELMKDLCFNLDDVKAIILSHGPGSFTGLRIGSSAVKGLCFGRSMKLISYSTTLGIAASILSKKDFNGQVHAIVDARRSHLYYQSIHIEDGIIKDINPEQILLLSEVEKRLNPSDIIVGTGINRLKLDLKSEQILCSDAMDCISARNLIELLKQDAKDLSLNAYIETFGKKSEELKIIYSFEES